MLWMPWQMYRDTPPKACLGGISGLLRDAGACRLGSCERPKLSTGLWSPCQGRRCAVCQLGETEKLGSGVPVDALLLLFGHAHGAEELFVAVYQHLRRVGVRCPHQPLQHRLPHLFALKQQLFTQSLYVHTQ